MKSFFSLISAPFTRYLIYLLLLFVSISFLDIYHLLEQKLYSYSLYMAAATFFLSYAAVLIWVIISQYNHLLSNLFAIFIIMVVCVGFLVDSVCVFRFNARFSEDIASIILGTNMNEIAEFFDSQIDFHLISSILLCLFFIFLLYSLKKWIRIPNTLLTKGASLILLIALAFISTHNPAVYKETIVGKYFLLFSLSSPPDLNQYRTNPQIDIYCESLPDNIVLIIGESFPKSHCSLYGYNKTTNPKLSKLAKDSSLYVFDNVISPETHTIAAFKSIMGTFNTDYSNEPEWYKCTTIIEVLQSLGYTVNWLSNQSKVGMHENVVGRFADLCDNQAFTGDKFSGSMRGKVFDGELLPILKSYLGNTDNERNCYILHLMGSHFVFDHRYPDGYGIFEDDDYLNFPVKQRHNRSTLDNSILYNDSIVTDIIDMFSDEESIIWYFPDHGLDVYESSDNYCAHGKDDDLTSREAGTEIPFLIYLSSLYKNNFEKESQMIKKSLHHSFNTTNVIFSLIDLLGVDSLDNKIIKPYSLFH